MKSLERDLPLILGTALLLLTAVVYWPATEYGFFAVDDYAFVAESPHFVSGLDWTVFKSALTNLPNFWRPIPFTWLTFIADSSLFSPAPLTYHRTNVLFHALNGFLLFWVMKRATGSTWKSLAVAAIFALHPLRVESVAWITARKDLVSGMFFFLCLLSWERYARTSRFLWYLLTGVFLLAGLLSKPILVTVPLLLLVFDFWPLGRVETGVKFRSLAVEKTPFFILSAISATITLITQQESIASSETIPLLGRITDALTSYCHYLVKFVYPSGLAFLPRTEESGSPFYLALLLFAFLALATLFAWKYRHSSPFFLAGWLWYLAALVPNSGIVPVGMSFVADRYTYIPLIGVSIIFVWGIERAGDMLPSQKKLIPLAVTVLIFALVFATKVQLPYWRNSLAMADRIEAVSGNTAYANEIRAFEYITTGDFYRARDSAAIAISLNPGSVPATFYMAEALTELGDVRLAETYFGKTLELNPCYVPGLYNYGLLLGNAGRFAEAMRYFEELLRISPKNFKGSLQLGFMLAKEGRVAEALARFRDAVEVNPADPPARFNLAMSAAQTGQNGLAIEQFEAYLLLSPDDADAHYNLGVLLAGAGKAEEASRHFSEAQRLNPGDPATMEWLSRLQR